MIHLYIYVLSIYIYINFLFYSSGSTASVALITEEETFFSFLGDSPIIIWKNYEEKPKLVNIYFLDIYIY